MRFLKAICENAETGLLAFCLAAMAFGKPVFADPNDLFYPTRSDWIQSNGETNLSVFVFNDLNANGSYDLGDRAMAGIATGLSQDGAPILVVRSNINGFANYPASSSRDSAPLSSAGNYDFEVFVPPGWRISTENRVQTRELIPTLGSNAGLGFAKMLKPVGLERYSFIRGTYNLPEAGVLRLLHDGAEVAAADLTPGEQFLWPAMRGNYQLVSGDVSRPILVGNYPVDIGSFTAIPHATTSGRIIDFENMAPSGLQKVPNGYAGLNWFNLNIMASAKTAGDVGYTNGASSGFNILYTSSGHPAAIFADEPFDFIDINLAVAWPEAEGEELVISIFSRDTLLLQDHIGLSAYGPITYQPRLSGVTRIELATTHNWQAVIDDLVIAQP